MALWSYALSTVQQAREALVIKDERHDAALESCVNEASQMVESAWGRHVVSRGSITEYHPRADSSIGSEIYLNEWPVVSVTSVHEDTTRAYATPLVVDTDYIVSKPAGKLIRVSGSLPIDWQDTWRAVKVVYIGGYQNTNGTVTGATAVPLDVLRVYYELVAWIFRQRTAGEVGMTQVQDGFGNRTFQGPAYLTPGMLAALSNAGAIPVSFQVRTGERDA